MKKAGPMIALVLAVALAGCGPAERQPASPEGLTVAAAANVTDAFEEIAAAFTRETGITVTHNFGSTAQLTQQIEQGAPFDVFAAADVKHIDQLVQSGKIGPQSRAVYARGRLALWIPQDSKASIARMEDLLQPAVRYISIANPDLAPYGLAAVEALLQSNLWEQIEPKIVRAENVSAAKQLAASGNAEAVFTAYSLVIDESGQKILIDESLHAPIDQALGIVAASPPRAAAERYLEFVLRGGGPAILKKFGYDWPQ